MPVMFLGGHHPADPYGPGGPPYLSEGCVRARPGEIIVMCRSRVRSADDGASSPTCVGSRTGLTGPCENLTLPANTLAAGAVGPLARSCGCPSQPAICGR